MIDLEEKLKKYNQEQIIVEIEKMDKEEQEKIAKQIEEIDFDEVQKLYKLTKENHFTNNGKIEPINYIDLEKISEEEKEEAKKIGENIIKKNEFAVVTMAGGQGTRLGWKGPKGTYKLDIGEKGKYIFEILTENLMKAKELYEILPYWYIMTSKQNYKFSALGYFKPDLNIPDLYTNNYYYTFKEYEDKTLLAILYAVQAGFNINDLTRVYKDKVTKLLKGGNHIDIDVNCIYEILNLTLKYYLVGEI